MTAIEAIEIIEEDMSAEEDDIIAAYQYLYTSGIYRSLQGSYHREIERLLEAGVIS